MEAFMAAHPHFASIVKTPVSAMALVILGLGSMWAEKHLKEPNLVARYINSRMVPDLSSATMGDVFATENKEPGWDERRFDWDWFIEVQMTNASEISTTIDGLKFKVRIGHLWNKRIFEALYLEDLDKFDRDMSLNDECGSHGKHYAGDRYQPLPSLMLAVKNTPLRQEVSYRGWMHFKVFKVNQREVLSQKFLLDIWLVDAMQRRHELDFKKKDM